MKEGSESQKVAMLGKVVVLELCTVENIINAIINYRISINTKKNANCLATILNSVHVPCSSIGLLGLTVDIS